MDYNNTTDTYLGLPCEVNHEMSRFQFYAWGIVANVIVFFGLVGNTLSIVVLRNKRMKSPTSVYLIALAIYDCIVLLSMSLFLALPTIYPETGYLKGYNAAYPYMHPFAYPMALIAQTGTIYTTLGFTIERFIAVCKPLHAANMCTITRAKKVTILILICSVIYNIPRMVEYKIEMMVNVTDNVTYPYIEPTTLGKNQTFRRVYFIYLTLFIMFLIPFILLSVLNYRLIRAVKQSKMTRREFSSATSTSSSKENNLTVMLISVIAVFMVCQLPSIADNILYAIVDESVLLCSTLYIKFTTISNLMVVVNSAINFILYCLFGKKFRQVCFRTLCPKCMRTSLQYGHRKESFFSRNKFNNGTIKFELDKTSVWLMFFVEILTSEGLNTWIFYQYWNLSWNKKLLRKRSGWMCHYDCISHFIYAYYIDIYVYRILDISYISLYYYWKNIMASGRGMEYHFQFISIDKPEPNGVSN